METRKKLKIPGLYVISTKESSNRWCCLMSDTHDLPIRRYTSKPIEKITDFIKLFEDSLYKLDWTGEYTNDHYNAILEMEKKISTNNNGKYYIKK